jgi:tetratricopeptide (TPR) repeat protein
MDKVNSLVADNELGPARDDIVTHAAQMMEDAGSTAESGRLATKWLNEPASGRERGHSRAQLLMAAGRWADAKALLTKLAEADSTPGPPSRERRIPIRLRVLGTLGIVDARLKQPEEALRIDSLLKAVGTVSEGGEIEVMRARIHAQLGDSEEAVALAEAGRAKGWELLSLMNSLADDHWLVPLRTLPSFRSIMALND